MRTSLAALAGACLATQGIGQVASAQTFGPPAALANYAADDTGSDSGSHVARGGATWLVVWSSSDSLGGSIGADDDILLARSNDGGATWSASYALNTNAATDSGDDRSPRIASDGAGNWLAAWVSRETLGETIGIDDDVLVSYSSDDGLTWSTPAPIASYASADTAFDWRPLPSTDGTGNWVTVWEHWDRQDELLSLGTDRDLLFARSIDGGATWSPPSPLNNYAAFDSGTDRSAAVLVENGKWYAAWDTELFDRSLLATSFSLDAGVTWSDIKIIPAPDQTQVLAPSIAGDGAGNWVATWNATIGGVQDIMTARSDDAGLTWSLPIPMPEPGAEFADYSPEIATDGLGSWVVVWDGLDGFDGRVLFSRSADGGLTWTVPGELSGEGLDDRWPNILADAQGNWLTVWNKRGGDFGHDSDVMASRSVDQGASWGPEAPVNLNATLDSGPDSRVSIGAVVPRQWLAVWSSYDTLDGTIGADADVLVARSRDGGETWTPATPIDPDAGGDAVWDEETRMAVGSGGTAVVVWYADDYTGGTIGSDGDVFFARTADGGSTWSAPAPLGFDPYTDSMFDQFPAVETDGAGNWVAAWSRTTPSREIFVTRSEDDALTWTTPVSVAVGRERDPVEVVESDGVWLLLYTGDGDRGIMVIRSTDAGATWESPKPILVEGIASLPGELPHAAGDGKGGWTLVCKADELLGSGFDRDIFSVRSDDGGESWHSLSAVNSFAASDDAPDNRPRVAFDGSGGWVVAWESPWPEEGLGTDEDLLIARSDDSTAWSRAVALNANATTPPPPGFSMPDRNVVLATDGLGGWLAAWESSESLGGIRGRGPDIHVARGMDRDDDRDGLIDWWETHLYGTDPTKHDSDGDGLFDATEVRELGTAPTAFDTDADGASDGYEVDRGTDPLDPQSIPPSTRVPALGPVGIGLLAALLGACGLALAPVPETSRRRP